MFTKSEKWIRSFDQFFQSRTDILINKLSQLYQMNNEGPMELIVNEFDTKKPGNTFLQSSI